MPNNYNAAAVALQRTLNLAGKFEKIPPMLKNTRSSWKMCCKKATQRRYPKHKSKEMTAMFGIFIIMEFTMRERRSNNP